MSKSIKLTRVIVSGKIWSNIICQCSVLLRSTCDHMKGCALYLCFIRPFNLYMNSYYKDNGP